MFDHTFKPTGDKEKMKTAFAALAAFCVLSLAVAVPHAASPGQEFVQLQAETGLDACSICEDLVGYIDGRLESNATESAIEDEVKQICNDLNNTPLKPFVAECLLLANNVPAFVDALVNRELNPQQVCTEVGLCSSVARPASDPSSH